MKKILAFLSLVFLILSVGCKDEKAQAKTRVSYDGEMIELFTPQAGDTFSWVLVTGNASVAKGTFPLELRGREGGVIERRSVILRGSVPDTMKFAMGIPVGQDLAPQKAQIAAYSTTAATREEARIPCYIIPGSSAAHGVILRFFAALDTNDYKTAYDLLTIQGQSYPNFYEGEALFSPRPSFSAFKRFKDRDTRVRVIILKPQTLYDLPQEGLFCYEARVEFGEDEFATTKHYYMFLKRQPSGFFTLYMPREEPHKAD